VQRQVLAARRRQSLAVLSRKRKATVITLIHRQETVSLLGIPLARYIDIDDAQGILRAIRETPPDRPIEIVLHTPGGLVLAAKQIASALADHPAEVTAVVPHYSMSGGTLIALAADEIVLDQHSVLGPVDPQLGQYPAASVLAALEAPGDRDDETLILADMSRKAIVQVESFVGRMLEDKLGAPACARGCAPARDGHLDARPSAPACRARDPRPSGPGRDRGRGAGASRPLPAAAGARGRGRVRAGRTGAPQRRRSQPAVPLKPVTIGRRSR